MEIQSRINNMGRTLEMLVQITEQEIVSVQDHIFELVTDKLVEKMVAIILETDEYKNIELEVVKELPAMRAKVIELVDVQMANAFSFLKKKTYPCCGQDVAIVCNSSGEDLGKRVCEVCERVYTVEMLENES